MSALTLVHVLSGTLALLVGAAVLGPSAWPRTAWVLSGSLVCIVVLGASATALTLQAWPPAPAQSSGESARTFEPARDPGQRRDSRPTLGRACLRVL